MFLGNVLRTPQVRRGACKGTSEAPRDLPEAPRGLPEASQRLPEASQRLPEARTHLTYPRLIPDSIISQDSKLADLFTKHVAGVNAFDLSPTYPRQHRLTGWL